MDWLSIPLAPLLLSTTLPDLVCDIELLLHCVSEPSSLFHLLTEEPFSRLFILPRKITMSDPAHAKLDLRVGGKYRLGKKIGSGSFGVYIELLFIIPAC